MLELPNYSSQLLQQLWALKNGELFCDCTVLVGDSPHRAHKLLLAASSMLFRALLASSDIIKIDTAVVSSQEFSCLLDMVYTGRLPLGKHNVSRIIAAADTLQMFDVAIAFKKVLNTILNPQSSPPEEAAQVLSQDEVKKDDAEASVSTQELPRETDRHNESLSPERQKKQKKWHQSSDSDCSYEPERKRTDQRGASAPHETSKEDVDKQEVSNERPDATELRVLEHSSVIMEVLKELPAVTDLLRQAAESSLDQQDRQVVMLCCDTVDPDKVGETLLSHVEKGVLSETALTTLLRTLHKNNPTASTRLQSVLQELESEGAGPKLLEDSTKRSSEAEEDDTKEGRGSEEESKTDDSDDHTPKKAPSSPSSQTHTCRFCEKTFAFKCRLQAHKKRCGKPKKKHQCPKCPEKCPSLSALIRHQVRAHKKRVECELCGRTFAHPSGMMYHMRSEHLEERPFTCKECGARFAAKTSLQNHERLHTGEKPYVCTECDMSFTVAAGLAYHTKKKHSQGNMYACQYCKAEFAQSIELTRHVRTHTRDRPYVCRECGRGYIQASQLTAHLESAHAASETFDCQKCSLSFSSQMEHSSHIQELHPNEFHTCPACEQGFPSVHLLNKHKSTHKGVKLFSCDLCNKSYQQLSGLWYHNRTQHPEAFGNHARHIRCDVCFKFFPNDDTLAQHQATEHQGSSGSPLRCPLCPVVLTGEDLMLEHITTDHPVQSETVCMLTQHPQTQEEQETPAREVPAEASPDTVDDAEQERAAERLLQAGPAQTENLEQSEAQEYVQQVFVALAGGQEGVQVVEMSMFD